MERIINIDWLECYCIESADHPLDVERLQKDFEVEQRIYGTPQYACVLLLKYNGKPYMEVRRLPYSKKSQGGIMEDHACHIRLANRTCYFDNPAMVMINFIERYNLEFKSISRIDICCDFNQFDNLTYPADFVKRYFGDKYVKIRQNRFKSYSKEHALLRPGYQSVDAKRPRVEFLSDGKEEISAHGSDGWKGKKYNYVGWGSESSPVSAKLYDKTLELNREGHVKQYIKDQWAGHLVDNVAEPHEHVWRLEFSIKSEIKQFVRLDDGSLLDNTLAYYSDRYNLLMTFRSLYDIYMDFRVVETDDYGQLKRKDRLSRVELFRWKEDIVVKPHRPNAKKDPTRTDRLLIKRLRKMIGQDLTAYPDNHVQNAAAKVLHLLQLRLMPPSLGEREQAFMAVLKELSEYYDAAHPFGQLLSDAAATLMLELNKQFNVDLLEDFNKFSTLKYKQFSEGFRQEVQPEYRYPMEQRSMDEKPRGLLEDGEYYGFEADNPDGV